MGKPALADIALMADALREIATITGCPANADPLTDLDGLVSMVRGLAERAETLTVVTADRDALRIRLVTTKAALEAAGYPHVDGQPLADRVAVLLTQDPEATENSWVAHVLDLDIVTGGCDPLDALRMALDAVGVSVIAAIEDERDPFEIDVAAPDHVWAVFRKTMSTGTPVPSR